MDKSIGKTNLGPRQVANMLFESLVPEIRATANVTAAFTHREQ